MVKIKKSDSVKLSSAQMMIEQLKEEQEYRLRMMNKDQEMKLWKPKN